MQKTQELQNSYPDSAYALAEHILQQSEKLDYAEGISSAYMRMGSILNMRGENRKATEYCLKALAIRKETQDHEGAASTCIRLSYIHSSQGEIDSTFYYLYEALRLNKLSGIEKDLAVTLIELGNAMIAYKEPKLSLDYFFEAEEIAKRLNLKEELLGTYNGLGNYYFNEGHYPVALGYFIRCDSLLADGSDQMAKGQIQNNIALCHEQLKDYAKAYTHYRNALALYDELELLSESALTYYNMGNMFNSRQMPDSAIFNLERSLELARRVADMTRVAGCYEFISDAYLLKEDFGKAYDYLLKSKIINDSLLTAKKISSISEMQTKYETEIKEKEIDNLNIQNESKTSQRNSLILGSLLLLVSLLVVLRQRNRINKEMLKSEGLLLNILPSEIAEELKNTGTTVAKHYNHVTVLFTDFANFTGMSEKMSPTELVEEIHANFTAFDTIIEKHGIEKIKTIGDSYMCVGGLPLANETHAEDVVNAGLEIQQFVVNRIAERAAQGKLPFEVRIGIHTGSVVAGIVGVKKFAYDVWGDTVNTASRIESAGQVGKVNISQSTYELLKDDADFTFESRGKIEAKGKGEMEMYFVSKA